MPQATTHSPVQDIKAAEAEATRSVEEAKRLAGKEVEAFSAEEDTRQEKRKNALKEEARKNIKGEEEALKDILKKGKAETEKELKALKAACKKNEPAIVKKLVDQFLSQT